MTVTLETPLSDWTEPPLLADDMRLAEAERATPLSMPCGGEFMMPLAEASEYIELLERRRESDSDQDLRVEAKAVARARLGLLGSSTVARLVRWASESWSDLGAGPSSVEVAEAVDWRRECAKRARVLLSWIEPCVLVGRLALVGWMSEVPGSACRLLVLVMEPMTAGMETLRTWPRLGGFLESIEALDGDESKLSLLTEADEESVVEDGRGSDPFTDPVVVKFRGSMVKRSLRFWR